MPLPPVTRRKLDVIGLKWKSVALNVGRVALFCTQSPLIKLKLPTLTVAVAEIGAEILMVSLDKVMAPAPRAVIAPETLMVLLDKAMAPCPWAVIVPETLMVSLDKVTVPSPVTSMLLVLSDCAELPVLMDTLPPPEALNVSTAPCALVVRSTPVPPPLAVV